VDRIPGGLWHHRWWVATVLVGVAALSWTGASLAGAGSTTQLRGTGTSVPLPIAVSTAPATSQPPLTDTPSAPAPTPSAVVTQPTRTSTKASGSTTAPRAKYAKADVTITDAGMGTDGGPGTQRVKVHLVVTDATSAERTTVTVRWFANGSVTASETRTFNGNGTFDAFYLHVYETCGVKASASASINGAPSTLFGMVNLPSSLCVATGAPPQPAPAA
jgi:hypothetical protein